MADRYVDLNAASSVGDGLANTTYLGGASGFAQAVSLVNPGDTIYLLECDVALGTTLTIDKSGTSGNVITVKPYSTDTVIISGGDSRAFPPLNRYNAPPAQGLIHVNASYVQLEDITLKNSGGFGLRVNSDEAHGVYSNVTLKDIIIQGCANGGWNAASIDDFTVDNVTVDSCDCATGYLWASNSGSWGAGASLLRCDTVEIKNCTIKDNYGEGMTIESYPKLRPTSTNLSIHDNAIYNNYSANLYIHAIYDGDASGTNDYYNNVIYCTEQSRKYINKIGNPSRLWKCAGISMLTHENFWNPPIEPANLENIDIYNNLIVGCDDGIIMAQSEAGVSISSVEIQHNTVVNCDRALHSGNVRIEASGNVLQNNVFYAGTGQVLTYGSYWLSDTFDTVDYNCWNGTPDSDLVGANDVTYSSSMKAPTTTISAGTLDPKNYIPSTGSNLINNGADSGIATDFHGNARAGADTIGFSEEVDTITNDIVPDFSADDTTVEVNTTVTFSDDSTTPGTGSVDRVEWDIEGYGITTAAAPEVQWNLIGSYDVTLTIFDDTLGIQKSKTVENYIAVRAEEGSSTSLAVDVVAFTVGDASFAHSLGVNPQAVMFVYGSAVTAGTLVDGVSFGVGLSDATPITSYASAMSANDGEASGDGWRTMASNAIRLLTTTASTVNTYCTGDISSVTTTAVNLSWTGTTSGNELCYAICIGGADVTTCGVHAVGPWDSGAGQYYDVSGAYDVVIVASSLNTQSWNMTQNIGYAVRGGNQVGAAFETQRTASGDPRTVILDDEVAMSPAGPGGNITASFSDSYVRFTLNDNDLLWSSNSSAYIHVLGFDLDTLSAACGVADMPTTTGATDYTLAFNPGLLIAAITNLTSTGSPVSDDSAGTFAIFATDDTTDFTYGVTEEDAAATINNTTYADNKLIVYGDDQTKIAEESVAVDLGTAKFTMTNSTAGAGKFAYLAIEAGAASADLTARFVVEYPSQSYNANPITNEAVTFQDRSASDGINAITDYSWDFGDGNTSTSQNPSNTFAAAGTYVVELEVTDDNSATATYSYTLTVGTAVVSWDWEIDVTSGVTPLDVEVDWVGTTISGETIDADKSFAIIYRGAPTTPDEPPSFVTYTGFGTAPTISVETAGVYNVGIRAITTDGNRYDLGYLYDLPPSDMVGVITAYEDIYIDLYASPSPVIPRNGPVTFTFEARTYPEEPGTWDWDYGDTNTDSAIGATTSHEYAAVSSVTTYTVEAEATFDSGNTQTKTITVTIAPTRTEPRDETEIYALYDLISRVSGCIETTDWSKTGGLTYTYEATLDRPWATNAARVIEDGELLTSRASTALVDANAGSYYVTTAGDNVIIYVHTTDSDSPVTNGSRYRFIRPA